MLKINFLTLLKEPYTKPSAEPSTEPSAEPSAKTFHKTFRKTFRKNLPQSFVRRVCFLMICGMILYQ